MRTAIFSAAILIQLILALFGQSIVCPPANAAQPVEADVVIYGGTCAAITAAVQAKQMGKSVIIVSPDKHLGGMTSGGLGWTDSGNAAVVGGLAREFYHRIWQHYQRPEAWNWQRPDEFQNHAQGSAARDNKAQTIWVFEPHVAEHVFDAWVAESQIPVVRNAWLDREHGVEKLGGHIKSITTLDGNTYRGAVFIDATYEGDLMAAAGVSYRVGRESQQEYGEKWNGVQTGVLHHQHFFAKPVDPYWTPGDPTSGLLPHINSAALGEYGSADNKVQAYCFRLCLTNKPDNRVPFLKPAEYDPRQYELLLRVFDTGWRETFTKFDPLPNQKTDVNNHGPFSTDDIGANYDYPEASYERRRQIIAEHESYQQGLMYFLANDPRVPAEVRSKMSQFGLANDEFVDNHHWPHQLYIREARRMVGQYVMTEKDLLKQRPTPGSIGMGSYGIDSHNVQRYVTPDGHVQNEGDIGVKTDGPYAVAFGSILPKQAECDNLMVPVCVSSTHIAYGSIRMEPVFMILGQTAAAAASLAIDAKVPVQEVAYQTLHDRLIADRQVLEFVPAH
jgi:FAD dependent oxidoreductase